MANTYKNIIITPSIGSTTADPKIVFSGGNATVNTDIVLSVLPTSNGTLKIDSLEGSNTKELYTITGDTTNVIFSINRPDAVPVIEIDSSGNANIAPYTGDTRISLDSNVILGNVRLDTDLKFVSPTNLAVQLLLTEDSTNVIFSINRIEDSIPAFEIYANGEVYITPFLGNTYIGSSEEAGNLYINSKPAATVSKSYTHAILFG